MSLEHVLDFTDILIFITVEEEKEQMNENVITIRKIKFQIGVLLNEIR